MLRGEVREPSAVENEHRVAHQEERCCALLDHRGEGAVELAWGSSLQELQLDAQAAARTSQLGDRAHGPWVRRVRQDRHSGGPGHGLPQELQRFDDGIEADAEGQSGHVGPRMGKACDQSEPNGIARADHDDGDGCRRVLGGNGWGRRRRDDDVHLEPHQLGGKRGQPVKPALRKSVFDDDVLSFRPPVHAEPFPERLHEQIRGGWASRQIPDPIDVARRLRPGDPGDHRRDQPANGAEEPAPVHYSITWSARWSSDGGSDSLRAFAVLRLTTSSNCVGCSTGRSPGFAPLRILSTYTAERRKKAGRLMP